MFRRFVSAAAVLVFCVGLAMAGEIRAIITKVDGGKVTFNENKGKGEKGDEQTLPVADNVKVVKGKYNQDTKKVDATDEKIEGGLKSETFTKIGEKGVRATIITDDGNKKITEIRVGDRGKKQN